jgi:uncharacterized cupredoxin-like copper-binding protein
LEQDMMTVLRLCGVLGLLGGLVACGAVAPATPTLEPVTLTLSASDIAFSLYTLEVMAGQPVKLIYKNEGQLDHDFSVAEIAVQDVSSTGGHHHQHGADLPALHLGVAPGETGILRFTPTAAGTYTFECTIEGHKEAGMAGTLVVK